jgi:voltage-gated potassium channel
VAISEIRSAAVRHFRSAPHIKLNRLYNGRSRQAARCRFALLAFDVFTIVFSVVASLLPATPWLLAADYLIALPLIADFASRLWLAKRRALFHRDDADHHRFR